MKNFFSKLGILVILCLSLTIISCNGDDDGDINNPEPVNQTFFEKYDGAVWRGETYQGWVYLRLNSNPNIILENWLDDQNGDCYYYSIGYESWFSQTVKILENSSDLLILEVTLLEDVGGGAPEEFIYVINFTVSGNKLKTVSEGSDGIEIIEWDKSSFDVSNLTICE
ncbi:hypothetical protein [Lutimonas zeaxanthinifaciens]|uniref:hypothetical protein n=1 Tax=Lutimonas zeaxanthinifaciens TaxID=3060215 RepID=UPI00265CE185|nr:hypothetical protein [Lutimonas sp. YSD2104]WKK66347.1 hypothetical protein QZH61_01705 [Lutimonas sp. YSD2104]